MMNTPILLFFFFSFLFFFGFCVVLRNHGNRERARTLNWTSLVARTLVYLEENYSSIQFMFLFFSFPLLLLFFFFFCVALRDRNNREGAESD